MTMFDITGEAILTRPKILWEEETKAHGADLARVQVWDAFSELFLDSYRNEAETQWLGEIIADTPFTFEELAHILLFEVRPVCGPNLFEWCGEWLMFPPNWLIEKCMEQQRNHPFKSRGNSEKPTIFIHCLGFCAIDAYLLLYRVRRIRKSRTKSAIA